MLRFNDIADRVLEVNPQADLELLQRAYVFAAKAHEGQERLSGEPYLIHPLEVAGILAEMRLDEVTVAAGLLHDTLEDTLATPEEIRRLFGEEVAFLVEGLTKISKLESDSARVRQAESFRKIVVAMAKDIRILLIKLADRLHNMRTLQYLNEDARRRIARETQEIYSPLAHRLGIYWMKQELDDLAFRALRPEVAERLERELRARREARERYIEEVSGILSRRLAQEGLAAEVQGRLKSLSSIHEKMEAQGVSLDQIHDVIAFRIILDEPTEKVYTALGLVHGMWPHVPGRFKDYVGHAKPNGYRSLHTTVIGPYGERMEIQIRTREMHHEAEYGIAAHWKYKEGKTGTESGEERQFAWLRQLLEWHREVSDPHEFLETVKVELFHDEVLVFTPKGDVVHLPRGATPIDFAYAIHTEIGAHCVGARVNGRLVPLRHRLADGDTVEILTSPSQIPRKDWLEFVVSSRARNRIRHALRVAERERSRELGREILEKALRREGLSLPRLLEQGRLAEVARSHGLHRSEDLFTAVGYGRIPAASVVRALRPVTPPPAPPRRPRLWRRSRGASHTGIRVGGQPDVMVRFAHCCNPLPGDEVVGFITRGRGVTVHLRDCARAFALDPERRIDVQWDIDASEPRLVRIRIVSVDEPGLLARITKTISAAGVNIGGARVDTRHDQKATHGFSLWVRDVGTLNSLIKQLEKVKGVLSVERVRS